MPLSSSESITFIHGTGACQGPNVMQWISGELRQRGHRSYTPKLPNDRPGTTFDDTAEVLADALEKAPGERIVAVAYSQNGNAMVRSAARLEERGSRLIADGRLRVILVNAGFEPSTTQDSLGRPYDDEADPIKNTAESRAIIKHGITKWGRYRFAANDMMTLFSPDRVADIVYSNALPERKKLVATAPYLQPHCRPDPRSQRRLSFWPTTPIDSIICNKDQVVRSMYQKYYARHVLGLHYELLDSDHSPQVSSEAKLADLLIEIANRPPQPIPSKQRSTSVTDYWRVSERPDEDPETAQRLLERRTELYRSLGVDL